MSDTTAPKPTVASAAQAAETAQESATTALAITERQGAKIDNLGKEQLALTKAVSMMRERLDNVATGAATVLQSQIDGVTARLESMERHTSGETADWAPVIKALDDRLRELAGLVVEAPAVVEASSALIELDSRIKEVAEERRHGDATLGHQVTALGNRSDVTIETLKEQDAAINLQANALDEIVNRLIEVERAIANGILTAMPAGSAALLTGNTASAKVLEIMRMIPNIGKDKDYRGGGTSFKFRGVDQAMDATGHAMREVGLTLKTKVLDRETVRDTVTKRDAKGAEYSQLWTTTILTMRYVFVDPATGHEHDFEMVGEGRDVSDKSSSKAAAMACKYALFQALMVPVEGLNDTDSDSERPTVEGDRHDYGGTGTPQGRMDGLGQAVSQGRMTPAQAVNEYVQRGYQGDAAGVSDPDIGRPSHAYRVSQEDDLSQRAAFAARHLMEVQALPAAEALLKIRKAKERIVELGIGDYVVSFSQDGGDKASLNTLVAAALQSASAGVNRTVGAQGVTRQGQQHGEGARARRADEDPAALGGVPETGYEGSEQEYLDALKALGSDAPDDVQRQAEIVVMRWESKHND